MRYHTSAVLHLPNPDPVMQMVRHEIEEHDLESYTDASGSLESPSEYGVIRYEPQDQALKIVIRADSLDGLFILRESIEAHMAPLEAVLTAPVLWQGDRVTLDRPPHFRQVWVNQTEQVSPNFVRLTCRGENLGRFHSGGLHFRLLLPPQPEAPEWPRVNKAGSTVWPEGEAALHMAVYTFRGLLDDTFTFDVFLHGNGPTCHWVKRALGQPAGILGPGGGDVPRADKVLLAGDETAFPAIARMLEAREDDGIKAFVALRDKDDQRYFTDPRVTFVEPSEVLLHVEGELEQKPFVWFGGPKAQARALKKRLHDAGYTRDHMQVQSYW